MELNCLNECFEPFVINDAANVHILFFTLISISMIYRLSFSLDNVAFVALIAFVKCRGSMMSTFGLLCFNSRLLDCSIGLINCGSITTFIGTGTSNAVLDCNAFTSELSICCPTLSTLALSIGKLLLSVNGARLDADRFVTGFDNVSMNV